jgi:hypothetical protein
MGSWLRRLAPRSISDRADERRREDDEKIRALSEALGPKYADPVDVRRIGNDVDKAIRAAVLKDPLRSYRQMKAIEAEIKPVCVLGAREEETWNPLLRIAGLRREAARAAMKSPEFERLPEPERMQIQTNARVKSTGGEPGPKKGVLSALAPAHQIWWLLPIHEAPVFVVLTHFGARPDGTAGRSATPKPLSDPDAPDVL